MKTALHTLGTLAMMTGFSFGLVNLASAQAPHLGGQVSIPASSTERKSDIGLRAHTNIKVFTPTGGLPQEGAAAVSGPPFAGYLFETPASLACIYHLAPQSSGCNPNAVTAVSNGGSTSIAIVDAYDNPGAAKDLAKFSKQFGLPPANFQVVFATGTRPLRDAGWEIEESLDVQWAHAMAPNAKLYLVEAASNSFYDLFTAETVAASIVANDGGGVISNSWGGSEFNGETDFDSFFTYPGVVYFASAGDGPGVIYPSASPYVVAVGGTTLSRNASTGAYIFESAWNSTGGGLSLSTKPSRRTKRVSRMLSGHSVAFLMSPPRPIPTPESGSATAAMAAGTSLAAPALHPRSGQASSVPRETTWVQARPNLRLSTRTAATNWTSATSSPVFAVRGIAT